MYVGRRKSTKTEYCLNPMQRQFGDRKISRRTEGLRMGFRQYHVQAWRKIKKFEGASSNEMDTIYHLVGICLTDLAKIGGATGIPAQ